MKYLWGDKYIYLMGSVEVNIHGNILNGESVYVDLAKDTGWVENGDIFFVEPHLYFRGKHLEKLKGYSYRFRDVEMTSCDQKPPPWSIKAKRGFISQRGYAHLWHVRFCVKGYPILYCPYILAPAKRKRESGFLFPEIRFSSRNGFDFNLPYYQVVSEEQDFTFYLRYLGRRGHMLEGEYRLIPNLKTKGIFWGSWLKDRITAKIEDEEFSEFKEDGLIRPNTTRYWIRGKFDGFLFNPNWTVKVDLDLVSDQNYIREFDSSYTGFEKMRKIFLKEFGRDIDKIDSLTRKNTFLLSRQWMNFGMDIKTQYTQDLRYMNDNRDPDKNPTVQRIPEISLYLYPYTLWDTPFQIEADSTFTYFWRKEGINGERVDLRPTLTYNYTSYYLSLIPRFSYRETLYFTQDATVHRSIFNFDTDLFTQFSRIFHLNGKHWEKIRHVIKPEIKYSFTPTVIQDKLPRFDSVDRISPTNKITYSLTNLFTAKIKKENGYNYLDFLYIKIEQSYDFEEASREENLDIYPKRPFTDIKLEVKFKPISQLYLDTTTWISPYVEKVTEHETTFGFNSKRVKLALNYDYSKKIPDDIWRKNKKSIDTLSIYTKFFLTSYFSVEYIGDKDFVENEMVKQRVTFSYIHQCWSVSLVTDIRRDERKYMVLLNLNQLGGLEQTVYAK